MIFDQLYESFSSKSQGALGTGGLPEGIGALVPLFFMTVSEDESSLLDANLQRADFSVPSAYYDYADYTEWQVS